MGDIRFDEEFSFNTQTNELIKSFHVLHLTPQELRLLQLLLDSKGNPVSSYEVETELWPQGNSNESTRRALVKRLRAKLDYKFIETIHSYGYRLVL